LQKRAATQLGKTGTVQSLVNVSVLYPQRNRTCLEW